MEQLEFCSIELAGETGEALNVVKKYLRGRKTHVGAITEAQFKAMLADELADIVICADRLAEAAGIALDHAVERKFNKTSRKHDLETML
jgi:NTP pyrophosphatase (non-canonical NTP hydrolase)